MTITALAFSARVSAQIAYQNESNIIEYLGQEDYDQLIQSNPSYLEFLDAKCTHGFAIESMESEKTSGFTVLNEIPLIDPNNKITKTPPVLTANEFVEMFQDGTVNMLLCNLRADRSKMTYYVLGNTGKVLLIYPVEYINQKVNNQ